mgnify:CR=1 FL=1
MQNAPPFTLRLRPAKWHDWRLRLARYGLFCAFLAWGPGCSSSNAGGAPGGAGGADGGVADSATSDGSGGEGSGELRHEISVKASDGMATDEFGEAVALSGDGNTLAVGARHHEAPDGTHVGKLYVYSRAGGVWTEELKLEGTKLAATGIGESVALSGNGNTLAVSAPNTPIPGAVFVLSRTPQGWGTALPVMSLAASSGVRVALSGNGDVLVVVSPQDPTDGQGNPDPNGAATTTYYVFRRQGAAWTQEAALRPFGVGITSGGAIALSRDGHTLAVSRANAVALLTDSGSQWTKIRELSTSNPSPSGGFGASLALSADGGVLAVGAPGETPGGAAFLFQRDANWSEVGRLQASNPAVDAQFGAQLVLADDGNFLVVSAPKDNSAGAGINGDQTKSQLNYPLYSTGAAYLFRRTSSGDAWTQETFLKSPAAHFGCRPGEVACFNGAFGTSVACSSSGKTLAVGDPLDSSPSKGPVLLEAVPQDNSAAYSGAVQIFGH